MKYPMPYKRGAVYYFTYQDPVSKRRKLKSTRQYKKVEANEFVHEFMQELNAGLSKATLREYADKFFIWEECPRVQRLLQEGHSIGKTHVRMSRRWMERFIFTDKISNMPISDIRRGHVIDFRTRLTKVTVEKKIDGESTEVPLGVNTINKVVSTLKTVLSEAYLREDIDRNPGYKVGNLKHEKKEREILTPQEIKMLFSDVPGPWQDVQAWAVFNVLAQTGMRVSEVLALTWDRISFPAMVIKIDKAWKTKDELGPPKWGKSREIAMGEQLYNILMLWREEAIRINPEDLVFCWEDGVRLGDTWIRKNFQRVSRATVNPFGDRKITPHCLRHSLNTNLLAAGADPILVQAYLGWSNLSLTALAPVLTRVQQGYTHLSGNLLKPVADKIDDIYGLN